MLTQATFRTVGFETIAYDVFQIIVNSSPDHIKSATVNDQRASRAYDWPHAGEVILAACDIFNGEAACVQPHEPVGPVLF